MRNHFSGASNVPTEDASRTAFVIIDAIQDLPSAEQVAGLTFAFLSTLKRYGADNRDALSEANRRMNHSLKSELGTGVAQQYTRALALYMKEDLD